MEDAKGVINLNPNGQECVFPVSDDVQFLSSNADVEMNQ